LLLLLVDGVGVSLSQLIDNLSIVVSAEPDLSLDGSQWILGRVEAKSYCGGLGSKLLSKKDVWCFFLNCLEELPGFLTYFDHGSCRLVVWLHSSEVPSLELFQVDNTVIVEIEVLESFFSLFVSEFEPKVFWKLPQFLLINGSTSVLVELLEGYNDIVVQDFFVSLAGPIDSLFKSCSAVVFWNNVGSVVKFLDETFILWTVFAGGPDNNWCWWVVPVVILLHSHVVDTHVWVEDSNNEVVVVGSRAFLEALESLDLDLVVLPNVFVFLLQHAERHISFFVLEEDENLVSWTHIFF
jgi:hypothetical protein